MERETNDRMDKTRIKDSGNRRTFSTGAVRDMQKGKGRCDLMPLYQVAQVYKQTNGLVAMILQDIAEAQEHLRTGSTDEAKRKLNQCLLAFAARKRVSLAAMFLGVSKHYEQGALKYGEYNWQKGIPYGSYIDSAVRHLLKDTDNQKDEPHHRAFVWNILGLLWEIDRQERLGRDAWQQYLNRHGKEIHD